MYSTWGQQPNGKNGGNPDVGFGGVWGAILAESCKKRVARKLCRIILLHFGLVTSRIRFGKTRKPIIFMVFGTSGRDHDSQNQLYLILGTPNDSNKFKEDPETFLKNSISGNLTFSEIEVL